jgi:hypothetical protein
MMQEKIKHDIIHQAQIRLRSLMDRAAGFEPAGWGFESLRRHTRAGSSAVEQLTLNQLVVGSNPTQPTISAQEIEAVWHKFTNHFPTKKKSPTRHLSP